MASAAGWMGLPPPSPPFPHSCSGAWGLCLSERECGAAFSLKQGRAQCRLQVGAPLLCDLGKNIQTGSCPLAQKPGWWRARLPEVSGETFRANKGVISGRTRDLCPPRSPRLGPRGLLSFQN